MPDLRGSFRIVLQNEKRCPSPILAHATPYLHLLVVHAGSGASLSAVLQTDLKTCWLRLCGRYGICKYNRIGNDDLTTFFGIYDRCAGLNVGNVAFNAYDTDEISLLKGLLNPTAGSPRESSAKYSERQSPLPPYQCLEPL